MSFILAIVGRPNVGKSTLFNRLVGRKIALVDDQPGVTRDLREGEAKLRNLKFKVMDTAGLEDATQETLQYRMSQLSLNAIKEADACLFVIDSRQGVTAADEFYASIVRKSAKAVILIANKVEGRAASDGVYEGFSLGLGEPVSISAEHGLGMEDVHFRLCEIMDLLKPEDIPFQTGEEQALDILPSQDQFDDTGSSASLSPDKEIQISIIGRPNSGKSTLINQIAGNQRLLTGPEAGITRDAIPASIYWLGQAFRIFDTAGMRKKAKVQNKLEKLSVSDGIRAIRFSEIIVLVLDVNSPLDSQDLRIAALAEREGRCVIIVINKWDLENKKNSKIVELGQRVATLLPQLTGVPLVPISGLFGQGVSNLHKQILRAYSIWNIRVSTARLNSWLIDKLASHPPPTVSGRRIRMRYITQVKSRPPSFVIFTSVPDSVPESYKRYLVNGLRKDFGITGVPIRLMLRAGKNPYDDKSKKRRVIS